MSKEYAVITGASMGLGLEFAKELSSLGDLYVSDAFGTCHRAHASTEGVTHYLESVAGFLVNKEIEYFETDAQIKTDLKDAKKLLAAEKIRILELIDDVLNDKNRRKFTTHKP